MAAVRVLDRAGIAPLDIGVRSPSLDDVFLALTGPNDDVEEPAASPPARRSA
jgi:hypothetical protein